MRSKVVRGCSIFQEGCSIFHRLLAFPFFAFSLGGEKREKAYGSGNPCRIAAQRQSRQVEWREAPREVYLKNSLLRDFPDSHLPIAKINKNENLVLKIRHFTHFLAAPPLYAVSITPRAKSKSRRHNPQPRAKPNLATTIHSLAPSQLPPMPTTAAPQFSFQHKKTDPPHPRNRGSPIKSSRAAVCKSTPNPILLNYLRFHTGGTAETPITPIR